MFIFFSQSANLFKKWISTSSSTREVLGVPIRHTQMEKSNGIKCRKHFWFVVSASVILSISLFYFNSSALIRSKKETQLSKDGYRLGMAKEPNFLLDTDIDSAHDQFHVFNQSSVIENKMEPVVKKNKDEKELRSDQLTQDKVEEEADAEEEEEEEKRVSITNEVEVTSTNESLILKNQLSESDVRLKEQEGTSSFEIPDDPCKGKYIYVHDLPSKFNSDLVKNCRTLSLWTDMCYYLSNMGLGPPLGNSQGVFTNKGWYATDQFTLDLIFHNRMKQYKCLTKNSSMASAIYVPFYAGFEVSRYLWGFNLTTRDATASELVKWLSSRPEWKVWGGRDHFLVAGRITWDFRRVRDEESDWGNKLFVLPEGKNMSMLAIESSPWHSNDIAIPYPTYFHPSSDEQVIQLQNRMRKQKKRYLFAFAGAPRPSLPESIRNHIINQCRASKKKCKLLECNKGGDRCHNPSNIMKLFQNSIFCLQPSGDSYTRRSAFDSILAGCIPVFFHPGSAYVQYIWYFPRDHTKYSVLIPEEDVRNGKVNIETRLRSIPAKKVKAMREEVIKMIPRLVYADPRSRLGTLEDAFDVAVKGVLQRVEKVKRKVREGKVTDDPVVEFNNWKYELFGTAGEHEWDHFF